jgi:hypothetical protein
MNKRDVAKFHKYLEQEIPLKKISEGMGIETDTLKKFTPEVMKKVKAQHAEDANPKLKQKQENKG